MADVGDRHHQAEAAATERFTVHGVVEVACGFAVDGDQRQMADVLAPRQILFQHLGRQFLRLFFRLGREHIRQVVLPQRDLDFHAGRGETAQDFTDTAHRLVVRTGLGEDFHHDHLAGLCVACVFWRDQDILVDAAVFGNQEADASFEVVAADDEPVDVLQHLDDPGFAPTAPVEAGHPHEHLVAVQHAVHFLGRQIEVVAALFRHHETEAVGMPLDAALDQIELVRQAQLALAVEHQLAVALHRAEAALEQVALGLGDVQLPGEGVGVDRAARFGQQLQDVFAAGQRRFIALGFPLVKGIRQANRRNFVFACATTGFLMRHLR